MYTHEFFQISAIYLLQKDLSQHIDHPCLSCKLLDVYVAFISSLLFLQLWHGPIELGFLFLLPCAPNLLYLLPVSLKL